MQSLGQEQLLLLSLLFQQRWNWDKKKQQKKKTQTKWNILGFGIASLYDSVGFVQKILDQSDKNWIVWRRIISNRFEAIE